MRQRITHFGVHQTSKIMAVIYFIIGLIVVPFFMLGGMAGGRGGAGVALAVPFLYAIFGYLGTAIVTGLYNVLASPLGGIELDLVAASADVAVAPPSSY